MKEEFMNEQNENEEPMVVREDDQIRVGEAEQAEASEGDLTRMEEADQAKEHVEEAAGMETDMTEQDSDSGKEQMIIYEQDRNEQDNGEIYEYDNMQSFHSSGMSGAGSGTSGERKPHRGGSGGRKAVALALCCALIGGVVGAGSATLVSGGSSTTILTGSRSSSGFGSTTAVTLSSVDTSEELTAAEVYAQNVNSTVGITTETTTNYFGYETTSAASGSGFIVTSDGYIVTNYHVIEDSDEITVSTYEAKLVGYDEDNDVAVLKIDASDLTCVILGDSDDLNVGDEVASIGNPLGELTFSLTTGVVSALNRTVTLSTSQTMNLIQTDCAINSGNSGGALFNMYGEVIGITNAKYSSNSSSGASIDNIGFAIPINQVKNIITSIIESGTVEKSYIGVSVSDITTEAAASSGMSAGAVVQSVTEGSPAEEAGLETGDIITQANSTTISGSSDLVAVIQKLSGGDELVLIVNRDGEDLEITVTVGTQTSSALPDDEDTTGSDSGSNDGYGSNPFDSWGDGSNSFGGNGNFGSRNGNFGDGSDDSGQGSDNGSVEGSTL